MLSIIIPANNEASCIGECLAALLAQEGVGPDAIEIVVAANACTDRTVAIAEAFRGQATALGLRFEVLDLRQPGKTHALNQGDAAARGDMRLYLDADVICGPGLLAQIVDVLQRDEPVYASGRFCVSPAQSWVTRHYVRLWIRLPFMTTGVPGGGLFAVNAAARARWGAFPDVIADDSFVRLHFSPAERVGVTATYTTPMAEGWPALVRVRRRWEAGSLQIARLFPHLLVNEGKPAIRVRGHLSLFRRMPVSYLVYVSIRLAARLGRVFGPQVGWARGR